MTTNNNNEHKKLNAPSLRFPEFDGEWEGHLLSEYLDFKNGLNPDSKRFGNGIKFISVMDILNNPIITYDSIIASVQATKTEISTFSVEYGDILFQRSSETLEDVGRANVYIDNKVAIFGGFVIRGKKKANYNPLFFRYVLASPHSRKKIIPMGAGAQHFNIGQDGLSKVTINFPVIEEQDKIANLLRLLDERISTQTGLIDRLQSLMVGIRHLLIKRVNGKIVYLREISKVYQPQTISTADLTDTGYPVYGANGIIGHYTSYNHKTEQICIACRGNTCGVVNYTKPTSWITGNAMVINADDYQNMVYKRYLYHYLSAYNFKNIISGSGQPQIVRSPLEKLKIVLPTMFEQERIAKSLDWLQNMIDVNINVLNLYTHQKQYLLHQMFI